MIKSLTIQRNKSLESVNMDFHPRTTIIHGLEGKTSILEAIASKFNNNSICYLHSNIFKYNYIEDLFNYLHKTEYSTILIDNIENKLHPKLIHEFFKKLINTFISKQFIVTTVSPHILNCIKNSFVYCLKNTNEGIIAVRQYQAYGATVETILTSYMGLDSTRPDEIYLSFNQMFRSMNSKLLDKALDRLNYLQKEIGYDSELVKARVLVKRIESIGK